MRPINITISAFGPYSNCVKINFEKLGNNGVYLITGDTGAGKTTIFDSIVFALYGEASGKTRQASFFRSKYASEDTKTFVELDFLHNGEIYHIKRNPAYERPKKRGIGTTKQDAQAYLEYPDGRQVIGPNEVKTAVTNLLGLSENQFRQIVMIAQGDFSSLLLSSTKERVPIFRNIFQTEKYSTIQDILKNKNQEIEILNRDLVRGVTQYVDDIKYQNNDELYQKLDEIKTNVTSDKIPIILEILEEINKTTTKHILTLENKQKKLKENIEQQSKILEIIDKNEKIKAQLKELENELKQCNNKLEEYKKMYDDIESLKQKSQIINNQILIKNEELNKYIELDRLNTDFTNLLEEKNNLAVINQNLIENYQSCEQKYNDVKLNLDKFENIEVLKINLQNEKENLLKKQQLFKEIATQYNLVTKSKKRLSLLQSEYENEKLEYNNMETNYKNIEILFLDNQAGILAQKLQDGQKCLVCGSIHHPEKAKLKENAPSEAMLKKLKQEYEDKSKLVQNKALECNSIITDIKNMEKELSSKASIIFATNENIYEHIKQYETQIAKEKERLINQNTYINKLETTYKSLNENKSLLENQMKSLNEKIKNSDINININKTKIEENQNQIIKLKEILTYNNKKELEEEIKNLKGNYTKVTTQIDTITKNYINQTNISSSIKSKITILKEQISKIDITDYEQLKENLFIENEKYTQISEKITDQKIQIQNNTSIYENISKLYTKLKKVSDEYKIINPLFKTANGSVLGKAKINFETFVQITYFKRILNRANYRFRAMTNNQYELKVKEDNKMNSSTGLELDVIDHYNNTQRDSKTLSGGELFKASLALSLGLSDEIQASCGGVKIDTMFIDEGFGSLDEESLKQAIKTLDELSGGNRLIGIISHVTELKERIDKKIIVKKDKLNGSNVVVEV